MPVVGTMSNAWFQVLPVVYILPSINWFWICGCGLGHIGGGGVYRCPCELRHGYQSGVGGQRRRG
jgi:hypothetical protein